MLDFKRHLWSSLIAWKANPKRKPLILRGARQVGKTTLVRQFGATFKHFIELNLEKEIDRQLVERSQSAQQLAEALSLERQLSSSEWPDTLLFIDEIQELPKAIGFLRFFHEEVKHLHVIAAGSLLEHSLKKVRSFPVGRVSYLYLFPLNFREYLSAMGNTLLLERLDHIPVDEVAHPVLLKAFNQYGIVGGMPEIVAEYTEQQDITALPPIYESIWNTYKDDVVKYAHNSTEEKVIKHIMNTASSMVDQRIKFQNFGHSNYKSREVSESFRSLDQAKVIQIIYPSTQMSLPLMPDYKKSPRLQLLDTGLLNFDLNIQAKLLSMNDLSTAYHGAVIPHLVTQELISLNKSAYQKPNFWVRDKPQSSAEVDLLYVRNGLVIPIEIKSGATGTLKSLHQFIDQAPHSFGVRLYAGPFKIEQSKTRSGKSFHLMNLPYYLGTYLNEYLDYFMSAHNKV